LCFADSKAKLLVARTITETAEGVEKEKAKALNFGDGFGLICIRIIVQLFQR